MIIKHHNITIKYSKVHVNNVEFPPPSKNTSRHESLLPAHVLEQNITNSSCYICPFAKFTFGLHIHIHIRRWCVQEGIFAITFSSECIPVESMNRGVRQKNYFWCNFKVPFLFFTSSMSIFENVFYNILSTVDTAAACSMTMTMLFLSLFGSEKLHECCNKSCRVDGVDECRESWE